MAIKYICDICGASSPMESTMRTIRSNDRILAQCCLTCNQAVENSIKQIMSDKAKPEEVKQPEEQIEKPVEVTQDGGTQQLGSLPQTGGSQGENPSRAG